jgi:hypothetical protein
MSAEQPMDPFACAAVAVFGVLALGLAATTFWSHWQSRQDLLSMRSQDRRLLYERVLGATMEACAQGRQPDLTEYCREQGQYLALFPECDESCRSLSRRFSPSPTK